METLTERDRHVLVLITKGKTRKQIADILFIDDNAAKRDFTFWRKWHKTAQH